MTGTVSSAATFCATLADEWVRSGVAHAVVAPGSRSTPLAVAVARETGIEVHVVLDERSAAFVALGIGRATGRPAVVVTTSGTAAVELHPAVVEAHQDGVPMICATADRPPELHDVGAPQTVEQPGLYGRSTRWSTNPGPPDPATAGTWRSLGARSVIEALGGAGRAAGPVHLNLAFREPLLGDPAPIPPGRPAGDPWHKRPVANAALTDGALGELIGELAGRRGIIVGGGGAGDATALHGLAETLGWPVLADPRSGARIPRPTTVAYFDQMLRVPTFAGAHRPDAVLRFGRLPASKVLGQFLAECGAGEFVVAGDGAWIDPSHTATGLIRANPADTCVRLAAAKPEPASPDWLASWRAADDAAAAAIGASLAGEPSLSEPTIARAALAAIPPGGSLVVSSSMPVRDVEWFAEPHAHGIVVHANRGANGIDGVLSSAVGVAIGSGRPAVALLGDLAFLHDSNALLSLIRRRLDLTIVVVDNRGGGIFSFLPQAAELPAGEFETLFGTPQPTDLVALAQAHGVDATAATDAAAVRQAVRAGGTKVVVFQTDRADNVRVHESLASSVVAAIGG